MERCDPLRAPAEGRKTAPPQPPLSARAHCGAQHPVTDATRLYYALLLGASMTAALLAALGPWVAPSPTDAKGARIGAALWSMAMVAWPVWAAVATFQRTFQPWHGAVAAGVALALALVVPPVARAVGALPIGGVVGLSVVRLAGLVRVAALTEGWLPRRYVTASVVGDVVVALAAIVLVAFGLRRRALVRVWAVAGLATLGLSLWLQATEVRPMPAFESLTTAYLAPFLAASYVLVLRAAGRSP